MSQKVTKNSQARQYIPIEDQRLRVAAYCRVSTRHEEQCHSLEAQIVYYTDCIKRNPNWEFVAVYSDIASGVRTSNRPGYRQLMRNCAKGKVDLILVKSQPFWPGCTGNDSAGQKAQKNKYRDLH